MELIAIWRKLEQAWPPREPQDKPAAIYRGFFTLARTASLKRHTWPLKLYSTLRTSPAVSSTVPIHSCCLKSRAFRNHLIQAPSQQWAMLFVSEESWYLRRWSSTCAKRHTPCNASFPEKPVEQAATSLQPHVLECLKVVPLKSVKRQVSANSHHEVRKGLLGLQVRVTGGMLGI